MIARALLFLLLLTIPAAAGKLRTNKQFGGSDLPVSCTIVRGFAATHMSPEEQRTLIRKYHVSRKWLRQAKACMR